jgi:Zinc knuckle
LDTLATRKKNQEQSSPLQSSKDLSKKASFCSSASGTEHIESPLVSSRKGKGKNKQRKDLVHLSKNLVRVETEGEIDTRKNIETSETAQEMTTNRYNLNPSKPGKIKSMDCEEIAEFVKDFPVFKSLIGPAATVDQFITNRAWKKFADRANTKESIIFPDLISEERSVTIAEERKILDFLKKCQKEEQERKDYQLLTKPKNWKLKYIKGKSNYEMIMDYVNKGLKYSKSYAPRSTVMKSLLKQCVKGLPRQLNLRSSWIQREIIVDFQDLKKRIDTKDIDIADLDLKRFVRKRKEKQEEYYSDSESDSESSSQSDQDSESESESGSETDDSETGKDKKKKKAEATKKVKKKTGKHSKKKSNRLAANLTVEENEKVSEENEDEEQCYGAFEVSQFVQEEIEANAAGVCYGCKQPGHIRKDCPDRDNRKGMPKRFLGRCWNCGSDGHRYTTCFKELNSVLKAYEEFKAGKLVDKMAGDKLVDKFAGDKGRVPEKEKPKQAYACEINEYPSEDDVIETHETETFTTERERKLALEKIKEMENPKVTAFVNNEWIEIKGGLPDTGSDTTVGNIKLHKNLCVYSYPYFGGNAVRAAGGKMYPIIEKGIIKLKVGNRELGNVRILLVEGDQWKRLLIGRDILLSSGAVQYNF